MVMDKNCRYLEGFSIFFNNTSITGKIVIKND